MGVQEAEESVLRASANHKVGAFQHIFQMQIPDWMSEPWDAQHCHLAPDLHLSEHMLNLGNDY